MCLYFVFIKYKQFVILHAEIELSRRNTQTAALFRAADIKLQVFKDLLMTQVIFQNVLQRRKMTQRYAQHIKNSNKLPKCR